MPPTMLNIRFASYGDADYYYFIAKGYSVVRRADDCKRKLKLGDRVMLAPNRAQEAHT